MGSLNGYSDSTPNSLKIENGLRSEVDRHILSENTNSSVTKWDSICIYDGKFISESLAILEYIDETWKHNPIMPEDPYDIAIARFWVKSVDKKQLIKIICLLIEAAMESVLRFLQAKRMGRRRRLMKV
ncbi:glutathione S-transferase U7-like [Mangifera indica]|uniref:glutathione S-transferase U7-like n=1 Tax=Mangifera indica TaxID=29780 RepID=UPI001CFB42B2|nr:glutathione S-transferase U7-like [Mangifera indica]